MQKTETRQAARSAHRQTRASTTLNRKYVKRPGKVTAAAKKETAKETAKENDLTVKIKSGRQTSPKITRFSTTMKETVKDTEPVQPAEPHPTQIIVNKKLRERQQATEKQQQTRMTAQELKDQAIKKALATASKTTSNETTMAEVATTGKAKTERMRFGFGRVMLALTCAAAAVFAIVYFVSLNMPDVQFRATAVQLNATYPNYLPRNYSPTEIASENNMTTLSFENHTTKERFSITEERSSWDSNSLLNNYVKKEYGENYTTVREQGLTIYIGDNKATWVNGGVVYKLKIQKGSLTKKQISSIAVSF
ncbi:hypothetical protein J6V85_02215 [Candidatus Saccharibacteria bacterium]|nr:hypothetical protein [Candidatus Saccharibacteria bacterium]